MGCDTECPSLEYSPPIWVVTSLNGRELELNVRVPRPGFSWLVISSRTWDLPLTRLRPSPARYQCRPCSSVGLDCLLIQVGSRKVKLDPSLLLTAVWHALSNASAGKGCQNPNFLVPG